MSSVRSGRTTFIANEAIPTGRRVKYVAPNKVGLAGALDKEIGVSGEQRVLAAIGEAVEVILDTEPGSRFVECAGTCTDGVVVRRDVLGKVSTAGAGLPYGLALEAGVSADLIEVLPGAISDDGANARLYTFTGHNGAGACTLTGALVGDVVENIAGLTTVGNATTLFETVITVANQIQQVSATDLSAKNYVVNLIHVS